MLEISRTFRFEASHSLPDHDGKCANLHGHSWKLTVGVVGEVDPNTGFVVDYAKLTDLVNRAVICKVDHQHLGQGGVDTSRGYQLSGLGADFYPTSENLVQKFAEWILRELEISGDLGFSGVQLSFIRLEETENSSCELRFVLC